MHVQYLCSSFSPDSSFLSVVLVFDDNSEDIFMMSSLPL